MLTNMFYYNYYKPYMIRSYNSSNIAVKRPKIAAPSYEESSNRYIVLNKAIKNDIVNYASDVSSKVISLKEGAKSLIHDMENYNLNSVENSAEEARQWIMDDITEFVDNYNSSSVFFAEQQHSSMLKYFSAGLSDDLFYNSDRLAMLGVSVDKNGKLAFNADTLREIDSQDLDAAIGENLHIFSGVLNRASDMMTLPLSEHMAFKGLKYHYNYKMGTVVTDSFKLIEYGMLVNIAV